MAKANESSKSVRKGDNFRTLIYAILIALFIRTFIVQAFRIPSGSMEDTLLVGDFLLVEKLSYGASVPLTTWRLPGLGGPTRGDIIVFKDPRTNRDYIKRCVAVAGETIEVKSNDVYLDGASIDEPYKAIKPPPHGARPAVDFGPRRIGPRRVFMMGDNRNNSSDSREWGELDTRRIVGRAFVLYWSSDPGAAPGWVKSMSDSWVKGLLSWVLGKPRLKRVGTWLAADRAGRASEVVAASSR